MLLILPSANQSIIPTSSSSIWDDPHLSHKIRDACAVARANGYRYIWIDSCCIDKTSSSELSEAINSMYSWYMKAHICYAYLADVPIDSGGHWEALRFRNSRWFTRGWTLQELIAPRNVVFLSRSWAVIGPKHELADLVGEITGIDVEALLHLQPLNAFSIAQRLSWASIRETTREEDMAYSLLGIFNINMPTLYGEGKSAFRRLQEEIMRRIPDQSIFAWSLDPRHPSSIIPLFPTDFNPGQVFCIPDSLQTSLLAASPSCFDLACGNTLTTTAASHNIIRHIRLEYMPSPYGIRTQFQMVPLSRLCSAVSTSEAHCPPLEMESEQWYLAILGCVHAKYPDQLLGRICRISPAESSGDVEYLSPGRLHVIPSNYPRPFSWSLSNSESGPSGDIFRLPSETMERCRPHIALKTVYISHNNQDDSAIDLAFRQRYHSFDLFLLKKTHDGLGFRGYTAHLRGPQADCSSADYYLTLSHAEYTITINFRIEPPPTEGNGWWFTIIAEATMSQPTRTLRIHTSSSWRWEQEAIPHSITWAGATPWRRRLGRQCMTFNQTETLSHDLQVDLDMEFTAPGVYLLHVEVH